MEDFSITTRLTAKDYTKVLLAGFYKKPATILTTIFGIYLITTVILDHFGVIDFYNTPPYVETIGGLIMIVSPFVLTLIMRNQFLSNPGLQKEIIYTFSENGMDVQGISFKAQFLWTHIIKQKELSHFLILYHTKKSGNFIDKTKLKPDQIIFIKSKVNHKLDLVHATR